MFRRLVRRSSACVCVSDESLRQRSGLRSAVCLPGCSVLVAACRRGVPRARAPLYNPGVRRPPTRDRGRAGAEAGLVWMIRAVSRLRYVSCLCVLSVGHVCVSGVCSVCVLSICRKRSDLCTRLRGISSGPLQTECECTPASRRHMCDTPDLCQHAVLCPRSPVCLPVRVRHHPGPC